jgi:acetyl-CoA C-acetyltransferase
VDAVGAGGLDGADGKLPMNHSGELTAKSHPIDATDMSIQIIDAMQRNGSPGAMQVPCPAIVGAFNMCSAGYVPILEPVRG